MSALLPPAGRLVRPEPLRAAVLEGRVRPLSRTLALSLLEACCAPAPWSVSALVVPDPPASLGELLDRWDGLGPVPVSGDNAEATIWQHPDLNALYRAWHDTLHVLLSAEFTLRGEARVAAREATLPDNAGDGEILRAEGWGQALHHERHGRFPRLQRAFVVHAVRFGLAEAVRDGGRFA